MSLIGMVNFCNGKRRRENEMRTVESKDNLLRKKEFAIMIAVSLRTIDRMVAAGELEKVMVRGCVRFRESAAQKIINGETT